MEEKKPAGDKEMLEKEKASLLERLKEAERGLSPEGRLPLDGKRYSSRVSSSC